MTVLTDPAYEEHVFLPDRSTVYGPILSGFEVEHAVAQTVRVWIRDYLAEVERQRQLQPGRLPPLRSVVTSAEEVKYPEDQLPGLIVASPGTQARAGRMEVNADGYYTGRWPVDATVVISARGNRQAGRLARLYTAAVATLLVQQLPDPRWSGLRNVRRVELIGETYPQPGAVSDRTQHRGTAQIVVEVEQVRNWAMGPEEPTDPPAGAYLPDVELVDVTVIKEPLEGRGA